MGALQGVVVTVLVTVANLPPPDARVFAHLDTLVTQNRFAELGATLDSLVRCPPERMDPHTRAEALIRRGRFFWYGSRFADAGRDLNEAISLARQQADTTRIGVALRMLALTEDDSGHLQEAGRVAAEFDTLARASRDPRLEALARFSMAYHDLLEGHYAESAALYRAAAPAMEANGLTREALEARTGLARALNALGRDDEARSEYEEVIDRAVDAPSQLSAANAWNNLGNIEMADEDPATALADWNRALPMYQRFQREDYANSTRLNIARALESLRRYEEAVTEVDAVLAGAHALGDRGHELKGRVELAGLRNGQGRYDDAIAECDSVLRVADPGASEVRVDAEYARITALRGEGRSREALERVHEVRARYRDQFSVFDLRRLRYAEIELELETVRPRAALTRLEARPDPAVVPDDWYDHFLRARCQVAIGDLPAAFTALDKATRGWERWRGRPSDPEWRESRGPWARELYEEFHRLVMAIPPGGERERRAREAFDVLQRFKARTLEERLEGRSVSSPPPRATLAWLQGGGLRPGEMFLDLYAGADSMFLCAVTPHDFRWVGLPAGLETRASRAGEMFASHGPGDHPIGACEAAAAGLGRSVLGDVRDLVAHSRRIIVSADGALAALPIGALELEGRPLLEDHEVDTVPSATVLRALRSAAAGDASSRLLALAASDEPGAPAGAVREVRWLERHLAGVTVREGAGPGGRDTLLAEMTRFPAIHVAAHTEVNTEAPWRSGILLGRPDRPREPDYLRASTIAGLRLRARLAVLSGCESYGSQMLFGEGVLGLSTAFLSAGVPAVVCTLWPVDDRTTAEFMEDFYRRLADGATPLEALRSAQLDTRSHEATRHPFYWAAFTLVGDPECRVALRRHG